MKASSIIIAPFIVLIGVISGLLVYNNNFNGHLATISAEADAVLAISSSYVNKYSKLRSQLDQGQLPVPAEFRARAAENFNNGYSGDDHFMALMVGMPDSFITTPPLNYEMGLTLTSMEADTSIPHSRLIDLDGESVLRTLFPSIAKEQSCIDCHNSLQTVSHPWEIGDWMGAYVIDRGVQRAKNRYTAYAVLTGLLVSILLLGGYIVMLQHMNLRRLANRMGELAESDPLTSCLNRRGLNSRAKILSQDKPHKQALLALDIDHFKNINDAYGHDVGDLVLVWFSQIVHSELRTNDVFARVGGEEFIVCLTDVSQVVAKKIANRICLRVASQPFSHGESQIPVSVSIGGVQMTHEPEKPLTHYSKIADELLYVAKSSGRNQVVWDNYTSQ